MSSDIKVIVHGKFMTLKELRQSHEDDVENTSFIEFMECMYQHIEQQHQEISSLKSDMLRITKTWIGDDARDIAAKSIGIDLNME